MVQKASICFALVLFTLNSTNAFVKKIKVQIINDNRVFVAMPSRELLRMVPQTETLTVRVFWIPPLMAGLFGTMYIGSKIGAFCGSCFSESDFVTVPAEILGGLAGNVAGLVATKKVVSAYRYQALLASIREQGKNACQLMGLKDLSTYSWIKIKSPKSTPYFGAKPFTLTRLTDQQYDRLPIYWGKTRLSREQAVGTNHLVFNELWCAGDYDEFMQQQKDLSLSETASNPDLVEIIAKTTQLRGDLQDPRSLGDWLSSSLRDRKVHEIRDVAE